MAAFLIPDDEGVSGIICCDFGKRTVLACLGHIYGLCPIVTITYFLSLIGLDFLI
ncbi:MAG: hypothetical protein KAT01_12420 [Candidatus Aminicenantes bacterium]|nr:hypothetical protein [Candidatus Aminicenantes bacterium]